MVFLFPACKLGVCGVNCHERHFFERFSFFWCCHCGLWIFQVGVLECPSWRFLFKVFQWGFHCGFKVALWFIYIWNRCSIEFKNQGIRYTYVGVICFYIEKHLCKHLFDICLTFVQYMFIICSSFVYHVFIICLTFVPTYVLTFLWRFFSHVTQIKTYVATYDCVICKQILNKCPTYVKTNVNPKIRSYFSKIRS